MYKKSRPMGDSKKDYEEVMDHLMEPEFDEDEMQEMAMKLS